MDGSFASLSNFKSDMKTKENSTTNFFSSDSERFGSFYETKPSFRDRLELFVSAVKENAPENSKVLDFGCGPGKISIELTMAGYDVLGLDGSEGMIEQAKKRSEKVSCPKAKFECLDVDSFKVRDKEFDVIVCSSVLEYLPNDLRALTDLSKSVKVGGFVVMSFPTRWSLLPIVESIIGFLRRFIGGKKGSHLVYSLRKYSKTQLYSEFERNGLKVVDFKNFEFPAFGKIGVYLSRCSWLSALQLVVAHRVK